MSKEYITRKNTIVLPKRRQTHLTQTGTLKPFLWVTISTVACNLFLCSMNIGSCCLFDWKIVSRHLDDATWALKDAATLFIKSSIAKQVACVKVFFRVAIVLLKLFTKIYMTKYHFNLAQPFCLMMCLFTLRQQSPAYDKRKNKLLTWKLCTRGNYLVLGRK